MTDRLQTFAWALEHADAEAFLNVPGLGIWRAKHVRDGIDRGVLVVESEGAGYAIAQPKTHGVCHECAQSKGRTICEHCSCSMCSWFRRADERASPRVAASKWRQLADRIRALTFDGPKPAQPISLEEEF